MENSDAKLTLILGVIGIPCVLGLINFIFLSLERAILSIGFLIPISGYVMIRLGLLQLQWVVHAGFYIISAIALIKNGLLKSIWQFHVQNGLVYEVPLYDFFQMW